MLFSSSHILSPCQLGEPHPEDEEVVECEFEVWEVKWLVVVWEIVEAAMVVEIVVEAAVDCMFDVWEVDGDVEVENDGSKHRHCVQ